MVAFLMAVIANVRPHIVAGAAQAAPVPGPPAVGDCVLDPVPVSAWVWSSSPLESTNITATTSAADMSYPRQQMQPCSGPRYGEVVAVIANPHAPVVAGDAANSYIGDPNMDSCHSSALQYLGLATPPAHWEPFVQSTSAMSRPSIRQEAAGQHWVACVVGLRPSAGTPGPAAGRLYASSIRDAFHTGHERNQLGSCSPAIDWELPAGFSSCGLRHSLELFAFGSTGEHPMTRSALELSCQLLVRELTGIPDPTAGGALSIQVHAQILNATDIPTSQIPGNSGLQCGVITTGSRKLTGSLLALGRQPIPLA